MESIKNGGASLRFEGASYSISLPGFELERCKSSMAAGGAEHPLPWKVSSASSTRLECRCENELGSWRMEFSARRIHGEASGIEIAFDGVLRRAVPDLKISPLLIPELRCSHMLSLGPIMGGCQSRSLPVEKPAQIEGHHQLMASRHGVHLQLSYPLRQSQPGIFLAELEGSSAKNLQASTQIQHFSGLEIKAPALRLASSSDGFALMESWAEDNLEERKDFSAGVKPGWNSWDYYRWTVTEEEVLKNADFIRRDPVLSKHVKRIIVDDGWQYCYGEWEANPLFPNGMESLAKELSKMGFEPGLWFAPTIVEPHARIAQTDYGMLALGESGQPCLAFECMRRYGFVLDPTQERVRKHLAALFARYAKMGYKYFKLDFMGTTLKARRFADGSIPRSQIARMIVEPIWEAVKGKAEILGCNYRFDGGTKYVDAVRTGSDIHATWSGLTHNAVSVAARFWANKRLWINDPDFALCRGFDTSGDPDLTRLLPCLVFVSPEKKDLEKGWTEPLADLRRPQLEMLLSIVLAAGGAVNLSDNLPRLNASGLDLARRAVAAESGEAAIPLDLFESERPSRWLQKLKKGHRVLLLNWTDSRQACAFDLAAHGINAKAAKSFWNDAPINLDGGMIKAELEPRSCLFASIEE